LGVAGTLQQAGFIRYRRGHIRVIDVEGLRGSNNRLREEVEATDGLYRIRL
jgi:hypothetical protein